MSDEPRFTNDETYIDRFLKPKPKETVASRSPEALRAQREERDRLRARRKRALYDFGKREA